MLTPIGLPLCPYRLACRLTFCNYMSDNRAVEVQTQTHRWRFTANDNRTSGRNSLALYKSYF
jgi:hypothetical protein